MLKEKLSNKYTGGVGTSTKIQNPNVYNPDKELFTFDEAFQTLDDIDGKYLKDYLHLCKKGKCMQMNMCNTLVVVDFTAEDEQKFKVIFFPLAHYVVSFILYLLSMLLWLEWLARFVFHLGKAKSL